MPVGAGDFSDIKFYSQMMELSVLHANIDSVVNTSGIRDPTLILASRQPIHEAK